MFTGLVQALGTIQRSGGEELEIAITSESAHLILQGLAIGDSIAVDGICLTVTKILPQGFAAAASPETLKRTTLGQPLSSTSVNLESALRVGSKLGGHFVTGHVDGLGYLDMATQTANAWEISFTITDKRVARYIVPKGSIAVNGISLTIAECNSTGTWFKAAVIPHTYSATNLRDLRPRSWVNLEGDVLGKYVEKFLRLNSEVSSPNLQADMGTDDFYSSPISQPNEGLTPTFLAEHGYL